MHGKRLKSIGSCLTLDNWIIKIKAYIASLKSVLDVKQKQNEQQKQSRQKDCLTGTWMCIAVLSLV